MKIRFINFAAMLLSLTIIVSCDVFKLQEKVEMDTIATPTFVTTPGEYLFRKYININCKTEGVSIYYTTDGSDPANKTNLYRNSINLTSSATIRAIAIKDKMKNSSPISAAFTITNPLQDYQYKSLIPVAGGTYKQAESDGASFTHTVSPFSIGECEVTYKLWKTVADWAKENGYNFANDGTKGSSTDETSDTVPVVNISWRDAIVWCNAYSYAMNLSVCYRYENNTIRDAANTEACDNAACDPDATGYRLPTEGEWQYAAGFKDNSADPTTPTYASGATTDDVSEVAWWDNDGATDTSTDKTHPVKGKKANFLKLYDMSGNVAEFCRDWHGDYPQPGSSVTDYTGIETGTERVIRGGSYKTTNKQDLGVGKRDKCQPEIKDTYIGFRVVKQNN